MNKLIDKLRAVGVTAEMLREFDTIADIADALEPEIIQPFQNQLFIVGNYRRYATGKPITNGELECYTNGCTSDTSKGKTIWDDFTPAPNQQSIIAWRPNTGVEPELTDDEKNRFIGELVTSNHLRRWRDINDWALDCNSPVARWAIV